MGFPLLHLIAGQNVLAKQTYFFDDPWDDFSGHIYG
jgi:hypothetical protein